MADYIITLQKLLFPIPRFSKRYVHPRQRGTEKDLVAALLRYD